MLHRRYISGERFSVDGRFFGGVGVAQEPQAKEHDNDGSTGRNAEADWRGKKRSNKTHESTTDPESRLYRKSHNIAGCSATRGIC